MNYGLPTALDVDGVWHEIRSDFRPVLDILTALSDVELTDMDKIVVLLGIFYLERPENVQEAVKQCLWFINGGQEDPQTQRKPTKLMDWEQDFPILIGAINQVAGKEVRALEYLHWWTFLGYYMNLGDCMFAQIVSIRKKLKQGKKLEKYESEFYRNNRHLVDFKNRYTQAEDEFIKQLLGGG